MDLWWNASVEQQAFDRCYRIGQRRAVRVVRFAHARSIEARIIELQTRKAAIAKGALGAALSADEARAARVADLGHLLDDFE